MDSYDMEDDVAAEEQQKKKISFRFCHECSNMLYPKEDEINQQLMFACKSCHYSERADSTCVFRNALKEEIAETAGNTDDVEDDPTLPRTDAEPCPKCRERNAVFFQSQQRTAETGMALFFVCMECKNVWSTLDQKQ